jgi:zinc transport system permease protein
MSFLPASIFIIIINMLELFTYPFALRALAASLLIAPPLALLGCFAIMKRVSFIGDGLAHASLAGIAIGILAGVQPLPVGIAWSIFIAILVHHIEKKRIIGADAILAVLFSMSLAIGVIAMQFTPGFQPELISFLFGSILSIQASDLLLAGILSPIIFAWILHSKRELTLAALSEDIAETSGIRTQQLSLFFYIFSAIIIVLAVKVLGVILAAGLLIIPAASSRNISASLKDYFLYSILFALLSIIVGIFLSMFVSLRNLKQEQFLGQSISP